VEPVLADPPDEELFVHFDYVPATWVQEYSRYESARDFTVGAGVVLEGGGAELVCGDGHELPHVVSQVDESDGDSTGSAVDYGDSHFEEWLFHVGCDVGCQGCDNLDSVEDQRWLRAKFSCGLSPDDVTDWICRR
jgi:hypothetical protein